MGSTIEIMILDTNQYLVQGLKFLLSEYYGDENTVINFHHKDGHKNVDLVFTREGVTNAMKYCITNPYTTTSKIITILDATHAQAQQNFPQGCLSESSRIYSNITIKDLVSKLEQVGTPLPTYKASTCPRCHNKLTKIEILVLSFILRGFSPFKTAKTLGLNIKTVYGIQNKLMRKLGYERKNQMYLDIFRGAVAFEGHHA